MQCRGSLRAGSSSRVPWSVPWISAGRVVIEGPVECAVDLCGPGRHRGSRGVCRGSLRAGSSSRVPWSVPWISAGRVVIEGPVECAVDLCGPGRHRGSRGVCRGSLRAGSSSRVPWSVPWISAGRSRSRCMSWYSPPSVRPSWPFSVSRPETKKAGGFPPALVLRISVYNSGTGSPNISS